MKDFFLDKLLPFILAALIGALLFIMIGCFASAPVKNDFDLSEAFDKATCSHYAKDRKLFGTSTHNVLECVGESKSLSDARKEQRIYKRIEYCSKLYGKEKIFKTMFQTMRECMLYTDKK